MTWWPWVSAETYRHATETIRRLEDQTRDARVGERIIGQRFDQLLEKYHELRAALPPGPVPPPKRALEPLAPPVRSDLDVAIELQSGTDASLARHLRHWAEEQRLEGMDETELINHILHWPSSEDETFAGID